MPFGELPEPVVGREALIVDAEQPELFTIGAPSTGFELDMILTADSDTLDAGRATLTLRGSMNQIADEILAQARDPLDRQNALDELLSGASTRSTARRVPGRLAGVERHGARGPGRPE